MARVEWENCLSLCTERFFRFIMLLCLSMFFQGRISLQTDYTCPCLTSLWKSKIEEHFPVGFVANWRRPTGIRRLTNRKRTRMCRPDHGQIIIIYLLLWSSFVIRDICILWLDVRQIMDYKNNSKVSRYVARYLWKSLDFIHVANRSKMSLNENKYL